MITEELYQHYLNVLLAGNRAECRLIVQDLLDKSIAIPDLYEQLFKRSLYRVGELWETNQITVANEHLATAITDSLLNLAYPKIFATPRTGRKAVIACCANEFHQLGAKMVGDILELNGWDSYFLGANTPADDLSRYIDEVRPNLVGLSLSILSNLHYLQQGIEIVRADFPNLELLIGGQAFLRGGTDLLREYPGIGYMPSLERFEQFVKGE